MEFFREDPTELGCSIIYGSGHYHLFQENIQTFVCIQDRKGNLALAEGSSSGARLPGGPLQKARQRKPSQHGLAPLKHIQQRSRARFELSDLP